MREIKFRAWFPGYIENKKMYYFDFSTLVGSDDGAVSVDGGMFGLPITEIPIENIMQYTGLKDKNNNEIYEGDIVECDDIANEVSFNDGSFWIENKSFTDVLGKFNTQLEIIGNIYEKIEKGLEK